MSMSDRTIAGSIMSVAVYLVLIAIARFFWPLPPQSTDLTIERDEDETPGLRKIALERVLTIPSVIIAVQILEWGHELRFW